LIVNPLAGVGGRLAFKGSDDRGLVDRALSGGAARPAPDRARAALAALPWEVEVLAAGGAMGADLAGTAITEAIAESTAADTRSGDRAGGRRCHYSSA
jgi:predicted polyphosphate/ATP-dependent NAD kinase